MYLANMLAIKMFNKYQRLPCHLLTRLHSVRTSCSASGKNDEKAAQAEFEVAI